MDDEDLPKEKRTALLLATETVRLLAEGGHGSTTTANQVCSHIHIQ